MAVTAIGAVRFAQLVQGDRRYEAAGAAVLVLALAPLVLPFRATTPTISVSCLALATGWKAVMKAPSKASMDVFLNGQRSVPPSAAVLQDPDQRRAYVAARRAVAASPAYREGFRYILWEVEGGACAAGSRRRVALSASIVVVGVATLVTMGVARSRRESPEDA